MNEKADGFPFPTIPKKKKTHARADKIVRCTLQCTRTYGSYPRMGPTLSYYTLNALALFLFFLVVIGVCPGTTQSMLCLFRGLWYVIDTPIKFQTGIAR